MAYLLYVKIVKARGLKPNESPYVDVRTPRHSAKTIPATRRPGEPADSPEWNQAVVLGHNRDESAGSILEISVWDSPSEKFLGRVSLDLSTVPVVDPPRTPPMAPQWYKLGGDGGGDRSSGEVSGEIQLAAWIGTQKAATVGGPRNGGDPVIEEIVPSFAWTEESIGHYLLVNLPDFKQDHVKIQFIDLGHIEINGERLGDENKLIRFKQTFKVPENSDVTAITAAFLEEDMLFITFPKHGVSKEEDNKRDSTKEASLKQKPDSTDEVLEKKKDGDNGNILGNDQICQSKEKDGGSNNTNTPMNFSEENNFRRNERESGCLKSAMEMFSKNKGIILVAAVLVLSLGVLTSRKFKLKRESDNKAV